MIGLTVSRARPLFAASKQRHVGRSLMHGQNLPGPAAIHVAELCTTLTDGASQLSAIPGVFSESTGCKQDRRHVRIGNGYELPPIWVKHDLRLEMFDEFSMQPKTWTVAGSGKRRDHLAKRSYGCPVSRQPYRKVQGYFLLCICRHI